ncbi:acyltransferase-like protein [Alteromonadaceae bacterium 2753L.S.0a.02]|nr:acyltransferase-like protein [Alteromonadaceae bacterium 2753L.S.0a.02]
MYPLRTAENYQNVLNRLSTPIKMSRVVCILFMTFAHNFIILKLKASQNPFIAKFCTALVDVMARSSVPLLTVISGFLIIHYLVKYDWQQIARKRFKSLILPMISWNLLCATVAIAIGMTVPNHPNTILALTDHSFVIPLTFLRDLFVLSALSPLLYFALKHVPLLTLAVIAGFCSFFDLHPILLREQMLIFFAAGMYAGMYQISLGRVTLPLVTILFVILAVVELNLFFDFSNFSLFKTEIYENLIKRPICALFVILLMLHLVRSHKQTTQSLLKIEPFIFIVFLAHPLLTHFLSAALGKFGLTSSEPLALFSGLMLPLLVLVSCFVLNECFKMAPRSIQLLFTGKHSEPQRLSDLRSLFAKG